MEISKEVKRKLIIMLIVNISVAVMEVIGICISASYNGVALFQYYTQDSNIFALIVCAIFSFYIIRSLKKGEKSIPKWVNVLKYMSVCCLTVTFIVVVCVLIPIEGFDSFHSMMFERSSLYHHFLCPVVSFISFVFFDGKFAYEKKYSFFAVIPTIVYALISTFLNIIKVLYGPYPFLHVYEQSVVMSFIWFIVIIGGAYIFALIIQFLCGIGKRIF